MREQENLLLGRAPCSPLCPAKRSIARLACAPEADAKGPAPRAKQVVLAGEIQLPHAWTAVSDQTGADFVEVACLALAECRLKGFKQHVQARDRSAAHTSRTKTRPSRCLNGAAAADDQVLQQRSSGSSTRQVQGMPAGSPSCRFQGEDGEPRRTSARHQPARASNRVREPLFGLTLGELGTTQVAGNVARNPDGFMAWRS